MPEQKRPLYRKWFDTSDGTEHFICIQPGGTMLEIIIDNDHPLGLKCTIYQSSPAHPFNPKIFRDHKEICPKAEWVAAQREAIRLIKGSMLSTLKKPIHA